MSMLIRTLLVVALVATAVSPAFAQPVNGSESSEVPLPERTIDIGAPEPIEGDRVGPGGEVVDVTTAPDTETLVPNRSSFVERLIESAEDI